jgi:hypothetical protein
VFRHLVACAPLPRPHRALLVGLLLAVGAPRPAHADPADYVIVPYTEAGRFQLAWAAGSERERERAGGGSARSQTLTLGYTPTDRYSTQVYVSWAADPGGSLRYGEWAWLNQFMVTTPGSGAFDAGALCGIEKPHERAEGTQILCGALIEWDTDHVQLNLNPLLERTRIADRPSETDLIYQWQAKTLVRHGVEVGAQGFGELGPWNHWSPAAQQSHTLGPAVFAKWGQGGGRTLSVDAAWLFGVGGGSPDHTLRVRLQEQF